MLEGAGAVVMGPAYDAASALALLGRTSVAVLDNIIVGRDSMPIADALAQTPALLKSLNFGPAGRAMTPAHTRKGGKLYRYYVSTEVLKRDAVSCTVRRIAM
jgi:hypothetical protein